MAPAPQPVACDYFGLLRRELQAIQLAGGDSRGKCCSNARVEAVSSEHIALRTLFGGTEFRFMVADVSIGFPDEICLCRV
jgi:hypothetical protein